MNGQGRKPTTLRADLTRAILVVMVVVVIALFAGVFWVTIPALRDAVRGQVSLQPFLESQSTATQSLIDLGQTITSDNDFLQYMRRDLRPLRQAMHRLQADDPEKLRHPDKELLDELDALRNEHLTSLWDQATRLLLRAEVTDQDPGTFGFTSKADLMVLIDREGSVLFELSTEDDPEHPEQLGRLAITFPLSEHAIRPPASLVLDLPLVEVALSAMQEDSRALRTFFSYQLYPDGHLYNMVAVPFQDRGQHLLLLGQRLDMRTAFHAAGPNTAVLLLQNGRYADGYRVPTRAQWGEVAPDALYGTGAEQIEGPRNERLVGPKALGQDVIRQVGAGKLPWLPMSGEIPPNYQPGLQDVSLAGESFVALAQPFLDNPREVLHQLPVPIGEVTGEAPAAKPPPDRLGVPVLGWLVLLKPTREIAQAVLDQQLFIVGVGVLAAILAAMVAGPFSRHVTTPVLTLARKMRGVVETGDLSPAEPAGSVEIVEAGVAFNQMVAGLRQKDVLEKFVPEETRAEVAQEGRLVLGQAQRITATVMFSDLRGFTSLSERVEPGELVEILGEYLRRMTAVVLANGGSIYEYIGDAILAVFRDREGASGAELAVTAALAMHRELRAYQEGSSHPEVRAMRQGIGLNTGLLVDGNIGMEERAKRAVIGDVVNLAARIQDRSRDGRYTDILVSESTYQLTREKFRFEFFGREQFKGKSQLEAVWEVLDGETSNKKAPLETGDAVGQRPQGRDQ